MPPVTAAAEQEGIHVQVGIRLGLQAGIRLDLHVGICLGTMLAS